MNRVLRRIVMAQVIAAVSLRALGAWWAERAVARLGKLSGKP